MATIIEQVLVDRPVAEVWDAVRDVGAIHTRLAPGFVTATSYETGVRAVTFANGATVSEPIVTIDDDGQRLVWSARGGIATHYNASMQVMADGHNTRIVWIADFLPDNAAPTIATAMKAGIGAIGSHFGRVRSC